MKSEKRTLLIVDDDEHQRVFMQLALSRLDLKYRVQALRSGNEAIAYLRGQGKFANRKEYPFPGYIITDLQMNDGDGLAVLEFLKKHPALSVIPVVVFSSSDDPDDIRHAYLLGACGYFVKPPNQAALEDLLQRVHGYWKDSRVPEVDVEGYAIETSSKGKVGERFTKPKRRAKDQS